MFVNGDGLRFALKLFLVAPALLGLVIVAHVVWIVRLARAPASRQFGPVGRVVVLGMAATLPVVGFYGVEVARWMLRLGGRRGDTAARLVPGVLGVGLALGIVVLAGRSRAPAGTDWPGTLAVCAIACATLGMVCLVLARRNAARAGMLVMAAATALFLFT